jgi:hypothetical protein
MENKMNVYYAKGNIIEIADCDILAIDSKGNANVREVCPKCGGTGVLPCYRHIQNGVCFKCEGARYFVKSRKLRTMEEALKMQEKYLAKKEKERQEYLAKRREEFIAKYETLTDMYVVYKDSYEIKDYLKELGYKFSKALKVWYGPIKPDKGTFVFIPKDEFYEIEENINEININYANINRFIDNAVFENSEYFGKIDDKYTKELKVLNVKIIEGKFTTHLVTLTDGNYKFSCFTNAYKVLDNIEIDNTYNFTFTVKSHDTYNSEKITYIKGIKLA